MIKAVIFDMYETLITHFKSPLYFGSDMARDAGVPEEVFLPLWRSTENERTLGIKTMDEVVEMMLRANDCYSKSLFDQIMGKRIETKVECFKQLHPEIIPMLEGINAREVKIGLISNCFTEEAEVIHKSVLFPYFDVAMLSCEQHVRKPDEEIYFRCMTALDVKPEECLYIGDGGSNELDTASRIGMRAMQAKWYLIKGTKQPVWILPEFEGLDTPLEVLKIMN